MGESEVELLTGVTPGLPVVTWRVVLTSDSPDALFTMVEFDPLPGSGLSGAGGGFGGPPFWGDELVNHWTGEFDGYPNFFIARVHPSVTDVHISLNDGSTLATVSTEILRPWGVRVVAGPYRRGLDVTGIVTDPKQPSPASAPQPVSQRNRPTRETGVGWIPDDAPR